MRVASDCSGDRIESLVFAVVGGAGSFSCRGGGGAGGGGVAACNAAPRFFKTPRATTLGRRRGGAVADQWPSFRPVAPFQTVKVTVWRARARARPFVEMSPVTKADTWCSRAIGGYWAGSSTRGVEVMTVNPRLRI